MATNYVSPGDVWDVTKSGVTSGDVLLIEDTPCVALTDTDSNGKCRVATVGVFDVEVVANDGSTATAVNAGDYIYCEGSTLNVDSSKTKWGKAREALSAGTTDDIEVALIQQ